MWVPFGGIIDLDSCVITKVSELHRCELSPIINNDVVRDAKLIHDL
jgi:hypothetical protein